MDGATPRARKSSTSASENGGNASSSSDAASAAGSGSSPLSFECNICFETPHDPVVTECGHLYCWRCLFKWMQTKSAYPLCPVCKSKIEKSKVIPVYGRGMQDSKDPREATASEERLPPRPRGHRTEVPVTNGQMNFGGGAYGIPQNRFGNPAFGTFSFTLVPSLFGLHFQYPQASFGNSPDGTPAAQQQQRVASPDQEQHDLISKLLLAFALFIIFCLLFT
mmetsp:Transcript_30104/g.115551  ORF Transcript_30104/g.115551 Transcript_30104/m.115551 type:complete len:222 (+) Transcript_30104:117-782(+)